MNAVLAKEFDQPDLFDWIDTLSPAELDALPFGVIGFDPAGIVRCYNAQESRLAGLSRERVMDTPLFTTVAPCMNNHLVAQRFEDAAAAGVVLDATIDYVFTFRMRPSKVRLRLLSSPQMSLSYVLVWRAS